MLNETEEVLMKMEKKNIYAQNQKEAVEISSTYEKKGLGKLDIYKTYQR